MKKKIEIRRFPRDPKLSDRTIGRILLIDGKKVVQLFSMELPWRENKKRISCIPTTKPGKPYLVKKRWTKEKKKHLEITGIPGREFCLFHTLNFPSQTLGCVGPGMGLADIDADGKVDVVLSRKALDIMTEFVGEDTVPMEVFD